MYIGSNLLYIHVKYHKIIKVYRYVHTYIYIYICVCVTVYIYIYVYIYTYVHRISRNCRDAWDVPWKHPSRLHQVGHHRGGNAVGGGLSRLALSSADPSTWTSYRCLKILWGHFNVGVWVEGKTSWTNAALSLSLNNLRAVISACCGYQAMGHPG